MRSSLSNRTLNIPLGRDSTTDPSWLNFCSEVSFFGDLAMRAKPGGAWEGVWRNWEVGKEIETTERWDLTGGKRRVDGGRKWD
uniref:Uncharacterized protein n=1 Tax=Cucumis melo TaxID=3656 RepID=A0A9I9EEI4_CUCME